MAGVENGIDILHRTVSRRQFLSSSVRLGAGVAGLFYIRDLETIQSLLLGNEKFTPSLEGLENSLSLEVEKYPLTTSVSVMNLQTGEKVHVNGDDLCNTGCTINWLVLMSVVKDLEKGMYPEEEVGKDIENTIRYSDAFLARKLLIRTGNGNVIKGLEKVNGIINDIGLKKTFMDHPPAYWLPDQRLEDRPNLTTANEMSDALASFWARRICGNNWTEYMYRKMQKVKPGLNYLLPSGVPSNTGTEVGHKNGFFWDSETGAWVDNDIGIILRSKPPKKQYAYAMTMFFSNVKTKYDIRELILARNLSSLVWRKFDQIH